MYYISNVLPERQTVYLTDGTPYIFTVKSTEDDSFCKEFDKLELVTFVSSLQDTRMIGYNNFNHNYIIDITSDIDIEIYKILKYVGKLSDESVKNYVDSKGISEEDYREIFVGHSVTVDGSFIINGVSRSNSFESYSFVGTLIASGNFDWFCNNIIVLITMSLFTSNITLHGYEVTDIVKFKSLYAKSKLFIDRS